VYSTTAASSTDATTASSSTSDATDTTDPLTSESANISLETAGDDSNLILIIVGVIAGVLVVVVLILVVIIVKRRNSNSNGAPNNSVSLEPIAPYSNDHYSSIADSSQSLSRGSISNENENLAPPATKSWEINYSELKLLEKVGEGAFGTVHRAMFRHQQVAVKQLKNQIGQKEVAYNNDVFLHIL
jgi:hypothetical protein